MSVIAGDFDQISEADILELLSIGVPEGLTIEFKSQTYGNNDSQTKEFLKDVSCFANTAGGHLIIGVEEAGGVAAALQPLTLDAEAEVRRLTSIVNSCIEPRVLGLRVRAVPVAGGHVLVFRIPRSWQAPHRVSLKGSSRFYLRNSNVVHEASLEELRAMFLNTSSAITQVQEFRDARIALLKSGNGFVNVDPSRGLFVAHLVPLSFASLISNIDIVSACADRGGWTPINAEDFTVRANFDGVISVQPGNPTHGYV